MKPESSQQGYEGKGRLERGGRSPLLHKNRACLSCHHFPEAELQARVDAIQDRKHRLLQRGGVAIVDLIDTLLAARVLGEAADHARQGQVAALRWREQR